MLDAGNLSLIRALQLASGTLPVGAYAYSQGMEWAVEAQWVSNEATLKSWLCDQLMASIATSDLPVLLRLHAAAGNDDTALMDEWSRVLIASRETSELVADDCARGNALAHLLHDLGFEKARRWFDRDDTPFAALAAVAAVAWGITYDDLATAYCWGWLEAQVLAGVKLIPLGQVAGQRLLFELAAQIPHTIASANDVEDAEIGATLPLLALASSLHETQYTRLFRS
jgi:urease accessory protein